VASDGRAIHTEEVPGLGINRNVPHAEQSSNTDNDPETEHGDQGNALTDRDLNICEVFCWPQEDEN
jgi:hypothetical protein